MGSLWWVPVLIVCILQFAGFLQYLAEHTRDKELKDATLADLVVLIVCTPGWIFVVIFLAIVFAVLNADERLTEAWHWLDSIRLLDLISKKEVDSGGIIEGEVSDGDRKGIVVSFPGEIEELVGILWLDTLKIEWQ